MQPVIAAMTVVKRYIPIVNQPMLEARPNPIISTTAITTLIKTKGKNTNLQITSSEKNNATFSATGGALQITANGQTKSVDSNKVLKIKNDQIKTQELKFKSLKPSNDQLLFLGKSEAIPFSWQNTESIPSENLQIEISKNSTFDSILTKKSASQPILSNELKKSGNYYWRISAKDNKQKSQIQSFSILKKEDFTTSNPKNEQLTIQQDESIPELVKFNWVAIPNVDSYTIEIAEDAEFKKISTSESIKDNNFDKKLPRGVYFWRVKTFVPSTVEPIYTNSASFGVGKGASFADFVKSLNAPLPIVAKPPIPKPIPKPKPISPPKKKAPVKKSIYKDARLKIIKIDNAIKKILPNSKYLKHKLKVKLQKSLKTHAVQVALSNNKNFKGAQIFTTDKDNIDIELNSPGKYFVKANYLKKNKKVILAPTDVKQIDYKTAYYVETPKLAQPYKDTQLVSLGKAEISIYFEWNPLKYATKYVFQMSADNDFSKILKEEATKENNFFFNEKLLQKNLYWRVKAYYNNIESKWSAPRSIFIERSNQNPQ